MPRGKSTTSKTNGNGAKSNNGAKLGFEQTLWAAADKQLAKMPQMGKITRFSNPSLTGIRQQGIKGFRKYLVFYFPIDEGVEILRVIHGARDIEAILDEDLGEDD